MEKLHSPDCSLYNDAIRGSIAAVSIARYTRTAIDLQGVIGNAPFCSGPRPPYGFPGRLRVVSDSRRRASGAERCQQLPPEAQRYIQLSREALAAQLGVAPEWIALESVTEPAAPDTVYVVKLVVDDTTYTYHGQEGRVSLVSSES